MSENEADDHPPEGYELAPRRGPFTTHNGPLYLKQDGDTLLQGIRLRERHCNAVGIVHGGMLMTFVDGIMGVMCARHTQKLCVTVRMLSDFLSPAKTGEWLEGNAVITRVEDGFAFCEGFLFVGRREVMRASAVFKLTQRRRAGG